MATVSMTIPQNSGMRVHAAHIEKPVKEFQVQWEASSYFNVLPFDGSIRWARVFAETPNGALGVALYHYGLKGRNFRLKESQ